MAMFEAGSEGVSPFFLQVPRSEEVPHVDLKSFRSEQCFHSSPRVKISEGLHSVLLQAALNLQCNATCVEVSDYLCQGGSKSGVLAEVKSTDRIIGRCIRAS